jgi:hypothetical protein
MTATQPTPDLKVVTIPYTPRSAFMPYHKASERFAMSVAHRRAGKTVARINKLVRAAASCEKPDPRFGYLAPYFVQAKDIAWNYLKHYSSAILDVKGPYKAKRNESELSITTTQSFDCMVLRTLSACVVCTSMAWWLTRVRTSRPVCSPA